MRAAIDLSPDTARRLDELATRTGRSREDHLREVIERGLEDLEDNYLAADLAEKVRRGEERTRSLDDVERRLGLDH